MDSPVGFIGSAAFWLAVLVVAVVAVGAFVGVRYARSRRAPPPPLPEPAPGPADAAFLDSSHIGGPIVGTEQFQRFNPDTPAHKGSGAAGK